MAKLLIEHGADIHAKDKFGLTPLMQAAVKDNVDLLQELEQRGAKVNVRVDVNIYFETASFY